MINIASTSPSDRDHSRESQIVHMLYENSRGAFLGSLFNIMLVSFMLYKIAPSHALQTWAITGVVLNLVRWQNYRNYKRDPERFSLVTWRNLQRGLTLLSGTLYGALVIFFFNPQQAEYQALIIFLVGGMGAAAVGTYAVDLVTYRLFVYSSVTPLILKSLY